MTADLWREDVACSTTSSDIVTPGALPSTWMALAGAVVLTSAVFWTVFGSITHAVPDDLLDPLSQSWVIAWYTHILPIDPMRLWDANILYPAHNTFTYQDTLLGWAPLAMPLLMISGNLPFTYNVLFLLSWVLCLWFCFLSLRTLLRMAGFSAEVSAPAAFLGGVIYAFLPYKAAQMGHLTMLSAQWLPLIFLCWECAWRRQGGRWWLGLGVCFVMQCLCCLYIGAYCGVALAILFGLRLLSPAMRQAIPWRGLGITAALTCLALLPILIPYSQTAQALSKTRSVAEPATLAPTLRALLRSSPYNLLYGWTSRLFPPISLYAPQYLFPGIVPFVLAMRAAVVMLKRPRGHQPSPGTAEQAVEDRQRSLRSVLLPYLVLWPATILLAQGPLLRLTPDPHAPSLPGPYQLLSRLAPAFQELRDTGRFTIISGFCLALLASAGLASLLERWRYRYPTGQHRPVSVRVRPMIVVLPVMAVVLLEYLSGAVVMQPIAVGAQVPPVYRWLARQPAQESVLELPAGRSYDEGNLMDYYSTYHWHPIADGISGFTPPTYAAAVPIWASFPSRAALRLLETWHIRYIIVHEAWMDVQTVRRIVAQAPAYNLRLVGQWGSDRVYEPNPRARSGAPTLPPASLSRWSSLPAQARSLRY